MSAQELKPCPFCGGDAKRIDIDDGENAGGSCICCTRCMASSNVEFGYKEHFIPNWNTRADLVQPQIEAAVKAALEAATKELQTLAANRPQPTRHYKDIHIGRFEGEQAFAEFAVNAIRALAADPAFMARVGKGE